MAATHARQRLLDSLAISASTICLIHCLLLPVLIVLVPTLATFLAVPEQFHIAAFAFAVPTSTLALIAGYRRHHWRVPLMIVLPGLALLGLGALAAPSERIETMLTVPGALLLALGHAFNWRALRHSGRTPNLKQ